MNQARASKINDSGYSAYQRVFGKNPPQMEDAVCVECGGAEGTVDDHEAHCPASKPGIGSQTSMETSRAPRSETLQERTARWTTPLVLETWSELSKKNPTSAFWHPGVVISNTLATVWIAYRGSVVKCARSQVQPFTEDDEAAHEHITEHMRDLGERSLHEGDFSYEEITGHEEHPVDLSTPGENTAIGHQKPGGEGQMDVDPESRRRMRRKTRMTSLEQPSVPPANTSPDTTQQETKEDHDDKRTRIDEPESTVPTAAQDEVLAPCPVTFDRIPEMMRSLSMSHCLRRQ